MVSALDFRSSGPGSSIGRGNAMCSLARHLNLMAPLSSQEYKLVPTNLLLEVTL